MDLQIGGIVLVPIIVAIVEGAKKLGLPKIYWPWLNAFLAVAFFALMTVVTQQPELLNAVTIGLNGLVIFLASAGLFDRSQKTLNL